NLTLFYEMAIIPQALRSNLGLSSLSSYTYANGSGREEKHAGPGGARKKKELAGERDFRQPTTGVFRMVTSVGADDPEGTRPSTRTRIMYTLPSALLRISPSTPAVDLQPTTGNVCLLIPV